MTDTDFIQAIILPVKLAKYLANRAPQMCADSRNFSRMRNSSIYRTDAPTALLRCNNALNRKTFAPGKCIEMHPMYFIYAQYNNFRNWYAWDGSSISPNGYLKYNIFRQQSPETCT